MSISFFDLLAKTVTTVTAPSIPLPEDLCIAITSDRFLEGIDSLADISNVTATTPAPLTEAFTTQYPTDAHFFTYVIPGEDALPRINKHALAEIRRSASEAGGAAGGAADVYAWGLVLDYDNPDHAPWTDETLAAFLDHLQATSVNFPTAWNWTLFYTTRKGCRFVYLFDFLVPVDRAELHHEWLCQQFHTNGIPVDLNCSDWTRCFRLPYVVRDGKPTWEDAGPLAVIYLEQPDNRLPVESLGLPTTTISKPAPVANTGPTPIIADQPDEQYARSLIETYDDKTARWKFTDWGKSAKKRLSGRDCYDCLFSNVPLTAGVGDRDVVLTKFVGSAIAMCINLPNASPEHIYGLFLKPVEQLTPDAGTPNWYAKLWKLILRMWSQESHAVALKTAAQEVHEEKKAAICGTLLERIRAGMTLWAPEKVSATGPLTEGEMGFICRHLIVSCNSNFLVMGDGGYYKNLQVNKDQLIPLIRGSELSELIDTSMPNKQGIMVDVSASTIVNKHATVVAEIEERPQIDGGFIRDVDQHNATLILPSYRRSVKLAPQFNRDVDTWLRLFFGNNYETAQAWLEWSLAFERGPICALSVAGPPGIGKKMLAQGLSETLEHPALADSHDITSEHQYGLFRSPFVVIDEGWARDHKGLHPADQFRHLVGGDPIYARRKYLAPVKVMNPARVIFTANNLDVVKLLIANRDMSPDDREALAVRLLHFDVNADAADWLQAKGGREFTGAEGRRWIAGDAGQESDFVVAKHFLWMYANKPEKPPGKRFLVEGNNCMDLLFQMKTQSGSGPIVIEILLKMIENIENYQGRGVTQEDGRVYVLPSEILSTFRAGGYGNRTNIDAAGIISVLKGLGVTRSSASGGNAFVLGSRQGLGAKEWYEVDLKTLLGVAQREGWPSSRIEKLMGLRGTQTKGRTHETATTN